MDNYNQFSLKDIEEALSELNIERKPLFQVIRVDGINMLYKVTTGNVSMICNAYTLLELDKAIRKGLCLDRIGKLEYVPLP